MGLRPAVALLLAIIMSQALAGCYLPIRFDAEIEITRNGYYEIFFDGYVAEVTLFDALRQRSLAPGEEQTRADHVIEDFRRDSATEEALYVKPGIFKINWRKSGDLLRARMITFFHRNENMLSVKYVKTTRLITVQATPIGKENARKLLDMGLGMQGQLRVKTDAKVIDHNAGRVVDAPEKKQKIYVWDVVDITAPPPKITIALQ
ncbi:MAG TPA: hypothetical protein QF804_02595 [Rhodospirillales bacterium]|nr:hypothetical protein [Rhodospirillales bacterium]